MIKIDEKPSAKQLDGEHKAKMVKEDESLSDDLNKHHDECLITVKKESDLDASSAIISSNVSSPNSLIINEESSSSSISSSSSSPATSSLTSSSSSSSSASSTSHSPSSSLKSVSPATSLSSSSSTSSTHSIGSEDFSAASIERDAEHKEPLADKPESESKPTTTMNDDVFKRSDDSDANETTAVAAHSHDDDEDDESVKNESEKKLNADASQKLFNSSDMSGHFDHSERVMDHETAPNQAPQLASSAPVSDKYEAMQPRLKKFLKIYQLSARNSVNGPTQTDIDMCLSTSHNSSVNNGNDKSSPISANNCEASPTVPTPPTPARTPNSVNSSVSSTMENSRLADLSNAAATAAAVSEQSSHGVSREDHNLTIIATVAAAAAAAASSSEGSASHKERERDHSNSNSVSHGSNGAGSYHSSNGSHNHRDRERDHRHHHHHHHHKRAKYSTSTSSSSANGNGSSGNNGTNGSAFTAATRTSSLNGTRENSSPPSISRQVPAGAGNSSYLKCIQADTDTSPLMETTLYGERISCFVVGGERRLCLHDILNTILKDFSVQQINSACQKLQIACLESSPKQLEILKKLHLLPVGAPNCGLLTQTNAERLCAYLMDASISMPGPPAPPPAPSPSQPAGAPPKKNSIKIFHECFGRTYGHLHMHMYTKSDSACVECDTCRKMYTPKNFVCHSHKFESYTRHWGFDSTNWRSYLHLVSNQGAAAASQQTKVLGDQRISNKDNIAANASKLSSAQQQQIQEDFEYFKQKFSPNSSSSLSSSSSSTVNPLSSNHPLSISGLVSSSSGGAFKRKSGYENEALQSFKLSSSENNVIHHHPNPPNSHLLHPSSLPPNKRLHLSNDVSPASHKSQPGNLSLLNEHLKQQNNNNNNNSNELKMPMASPSSKSTSSSSNPNNNANSSAGEHKLLNGLLSRPLNTSTSSSAEQGANQRFYINDDFTINSNGNREATNGSSANGQKATSNHTPMPTPTSTPTPAATPTPSSALFFSLLNQQNSGLKSSKPHGLELNGKLGLGASPANNIELNMLELILNEIETCMADNKEGAERIRQMITKMHLYYMDKLNQQQHVQNKILSEFEEFKMGLQNENDQLKCQLKLIQLQSELINSKEAAAALSNPTLIDGLNSLSNSPYSSFKKSLQQPSPQPSQQQSLKGNNFSNSTANGSLASNPHFQNMLLMQQQQQQQQNQKNQELQQQQQQHAAAVAAFPQFFLSHYGNANGANPLSTSTPKKTISNSSSTLSTNSSSNTNSSQSSSSSSSFSNPKHHSNTVSSLLASSQLLNNNNNNNSNHHLLQQQQLHAHQFAGHHKQLLHQFSTSSAAAVAAAAAANNLAMLSAAASKCEPNPIQQQPQAASAGAN